MEIEVWAALTHPLTPEEERTLAALLPPERLTRLECLNDLSRRAAPLWAYGLLRAALRDRLGWDFLPKMARTHRGKPSFPDFPEVEFSLSHTRGAVLAALHCKPLGVDIEAVRPVPPRLGGRLAGLWTTEEDFFRLWVRREARTKRTGAGVASVLSEEPPLESEEGYWPLDLFPGYAAGLSGSAGEFTGIVHKLTLDDLC